MKTTKKNYLKNVDGLKKEIQKEDDLKKST
jgi:hypothetical protein